TPWATPTTWPCWPRSSPAIRPASVGRPPSSGWPRWRLTAGPTSSAGRCAWACASMPSRRRPSADGWAVTGRRPATAPSWPPGSCPPSSNPIRTAERPGRRARSAPAWWGCRRGGSARPPHGRAGPVPHGLLQPDGLGQMVADGGEDRPHLDRGRIAARPLGGRLHRGHAAGQGLVGEERVEEHGVEGPPAQRQRVGPEGDEPERDVEVEAGVEAQDGPAAGRPVMAGDRLAPEKAAHEPGEVLQLGGGDGRQAEGVEQEADAPPEAQRV